MNNSGNINSDIISPQPKRHRKTLHHSTPLQDNELTKLYEKFIAFGQQQYFRQQDDIPHGSFPATPEQAQAAILSKDSGYLMQNTCLESSTLHAPRLTPGNAYPISNNSNVTENNIDALLKNITLKKYSTYRKTIGRNLLNILQAIKGNEFPCPIFKKVRHYKECNQIMLDAEERAIFNDLKALDLKAKIVLAKAKIETFPKGYVDDEFTPTQLKNILWMIYSDRSAPALQRINEYHDNGILMVIRKIIPADTLSKMFLRSGNQFAEKYIDELLEYCIDYTNIDKNDSSLDIIVKSLDKNQFAKICGLYSQHGKDFINDIPRLVKHAKSQALRKTMDDYMHKSIQLPDIQSLFENLEQKGSTYSTIEV